MLDGPQVYRHEERGSKYCPHRHLGLALFVGQTEVTDDQLQIKSSQVSPPHPTIISHHIGVIPMSRASVSYDDVLVVSIVVDGSLHRAPRVLDVVEVSPEIAGVDD